ncbi:hypothetical protein [Algoriphagus antarcticus]|uniref:Uncharacterized protein n=1 Tax=Algoriphagus antarcticus TaxID=238540 RepID=A0A3E0E4W4_9BACT|nr:hypothetical protein [Algoriphagus antarcticus]REG92783.1 hypothetical protein C8N25_102186 [Algoriphagus antarcticus]
MAEIKIEKKKPIWPWILLALLALALVWFFFLRDSDDSVAIDDEESTTEQVVIVDETGMENQAMNSTDAIAKYSAYIGDMGKMGIDHEYSNGALNYLIDAVEATANMLDVDIKADLEEARKNSSEIKVEPYDVKHADLIKDSGAIITRALTTLQKAKFPNLAQDVANVDAAVSAIKKGELTLNQKDDVNNFFKSSESLLLKMQ